VLCLYRFIVACRLGAVGFMFIYFHLSSFCIILLHCLSVCFIVFWYCWDGSLFIGLNWLLCMKFLFVYILLLILLMFFLHPLLLLLIYYFEFLPVCSLLVSILHHSFYCYLYCFC
jgi:hypothetical protein